MENITGSLLTFEEFSIVSNVSPRGSIEKRRWRVTMPRLLPNRKDSGEI
jgi:hypothetical protein